MLIARCYTRHNRRSRHQTTSIRSHMDVRTYAQENQIAQGQRRYLARNSRSITPRKRQIQKIRQRLYLRILSAFRPLGGYAGVVDASCFNIRSYRTALTHIHFYRGHVYSTLGLHKTTVRNTQSRFSQQHPSSQNILEYSSTLVICQIRPQRPFTHHPSYLYQMKLQQSQ